jgi:hypothetical protein
MEFKDAREHRTREQRTVDEEVHFWRRVSIRFHQVLL